jgi:hypothetical protein
MTLNTFITWSPKWLITFTAMRPDFGLSKGRVVSLLREARVVAGEGFDIQMGMLLGHVFILPYFSITSQCPPFAGPTRRT